MIEIENLSFRYKDARRPALENISLTIRDGDFVGIIGGSGAGKSTLTSAVNGIVPHHYPGDFYGSVRVGGFDTVEVQPEEISRMVGSVFQDIDGHMVASMVEDEILFGLENFSVAREEIEGRIASSLEAVGISALRSRPVDTLSGGQKQKVAIAAILALRPQILLLDEPTGELDPQSSRQVFEVLRELNARYHMTVVVVEKKIMLLCEYVRRLIVMDGGRVVCDGAVADVLARSAVLHKTGVNVPRVVTLCDRLRQRGLYGGAPPADLRAAERMVREVLA